MTLIQKRRIILTAFALGGLAYIGVNHAMSILDIKLSLSSDWKERFQEVKKLNEYAKINPVELSNVKIENETIDGAVINGGLFKSTDWKKVGARKSSITKVVFRDGLLENVDFNDSTLTDVIFEDVTLEEVRFVNTTLINVRFIHCTLNGVNIDQTKLSSIEISRSRVINTSLSDGQLVAVFKSSILTRKTSLTDLKEPSSLTFEKSELIQVMMERSNLEELVIDETKFDVILDVGSIGQLTIKNSEIDASFSAAKIDKVTADKNKISRMEFIRANVNSLVLKNCKLSNHFNMYEAVFGTIDVVGCPLKEFSPFLAKIDMLRIKDSTLSNSEFNKMQAKSMILDHVTLEGTIDFTGAKVGEVKTQNVIKQPGLKIITDGSNVHL